MSPIITLPPSRYQSGILGVACSDYSSHPMHSACTNNCLFCVISFTYVCMCVYANVREII